MNAFLRLFLSLSFASLGVVTSSSGFADIYVIIDDGPNKLPPPNVQPPPKTFGLFNLSLDSPAGRSDTMSLLNCKHPCWAYFPSGGSSYKSGDTFVFYDVPAAYLRKTDSAVLDKIEFGGVEIQALDPSISKGLIFTFGTRKGDLNPPQSGGSNNYPFYMSFEGAFANDRPSQTSFPWQTTSCPPPYNPSEDELRNPCARLQLWIDNGTSNVLADGAGIQQTATSSIPCDAYDTTGPSPCGRNGHYFFGYFSPDFVSWDSDSLTCDPSSCKPVHTAILGAKVYASSETLALNGYAAMATSVQEKLGLEELAFSLANQVGGNSWIWFNAADERLRARPKYDLVQNAQGPKRFAFEVLQGRSVPALNGVVLTSIGSDLTAVEKSDNALPETERYRNDSSYASFIAKPGKLHWDTVEWLSVDYRVVVTDSGVTFDSRLPKTLNFSDCANGSFRILVKLTDQYGNDAGGLTIYLGTSENVLTGCRAAESTLSPRNLFEDPDKRVEPTATPTGNAQTFITMKEARKKFASAYVRSVNVIVDQGIYAQETPEQGHPKHYEVELHQAQVNNYRATNSLMVIDPDPNSFALLDPPPATGRKILITTAGPEPAQKVTEIPDCQIKTVGHELTVETTDAALTEGSYRVNLCVAGGRCIPDQQALTLH